MTILGWAAEQSPAALPRSEEPLEPPDHLGRCFLGRKWPLFTPPPVTSLAQ